jgi:hypothetical protein
VKPDKALEALRRRQKAYKEDGLASRGQGAYHMPGSTNRKKGYARRSRRS